MLLVTDLKPGVVLDIDQKLCRLLDLVRHAGAGQAHGFIELKLRDIRTGHVIVRHLKPTDKVTEVGLVKKQMEFLYHDAGTYFFMDPETFEQVAIPSTVIGVVGRFMTEGTHITVELLHDEPLAVQYPKIVELKVKSTGPGIRDGQDNTMKPATLENGVEVLVPQFIEAGELVRVDTEKIRYVERVPFKKL